MAEKIILKHSSIEDKRPSPVYLEPGEIAINVSTNTPGMYFKDSSGNIRKIGPVSVSNNPPNATPSPGGSPGNSVGEMWVNPLSGHSIRIWDGASWQDCGAVGYTSDSPPESPQNGQLWFDTVSKDLKAYYLEEERWIGNQEDSRGISLSSTISLGTGSSPYEIFVDPTKGTDSFLNRGTDQRMPFKTLNRALIEAARRSMVPGASNDEYDKILIRCRNGSNTVYNGKGVESVSEVEEAKTWGDPNYQRFLDGADLLQNNRDWVAGRVFNALSSAYLSSSGGGLISVANSTVTKQLIRGAVDALSQDLRSGGNSNTVLFSRSFYDGNGVLTAFDDLLLKDLFVSVAIPVFRERILLCLQNRGANIDDTISYDTSADSAESLCSNVQQATLTLIELFERVLKGSLLITDVTLNKGTFPTEPTSETLQSFNDPFSGGLIVPRGISIQGADLRKTNIIPEFVPSVTSTEDNSVFRMTGGSYFFNFTFRDNPSVKRSHHTLGCFSFASEPQLKLYYAKVAKAFGLSESDIEAQNPETNIVFTEPNVDTTLGSSPYIFNCSVRSDYGLSGVVADGSLVGGLKSVVAAQFTNVSLQKDPRAWEVYDGENKEWVAARDYQQVIDTPVDSVRFNTAYRNYGFLAKKGSYMQLVSCFVIGDSIHYWSESGGDVSITNSTSNFGGTSCVAEGFAGKGTISGALEQDSDFAVEGIIRPVSLPISEEDNPSQAARRVKIGSVESFSTSNPTYNEITLSDNLFLSDLGGFTLEPGGILYLTDSSGSELTSSAAVATSIFPNQDPQNTNNLGKVIRIRKAGDNITGGFGVEGRDLFIKRYIDFRPLTERAYKLRVKTTKVGTRRPQINFIFRLMSGGSVGQVQTIATGAQFDPKNGENQVFFISNVEDVFLPGGTIDNDTFDLTLLSLDSFQDYEETRSYALGDYTLFEGRLYRSLKSRNLGNSPSTSDKVWESLKYQLYDERGLHQESRYAAVRLIINKDDGTDSMGLTREDYDDPSQNLSLRTVDRILELLGYSKTVRDDVLQPVLVEDRVFFPADLPSPSGGAALQSNNWPVEFNRPSLIRASGHTWEWVGYYNYSKAVPIRQNSVLSRANRESAIYSELFGGRVYANGLTEEGEVFEEGSIQVRTSDIDTSLDFGEVDTGVVSKVLSLQVGSCNNPGDNWLSTNNLKLCGALRMESGAFIEDRFSVPEGTKASYGNGVVGVGSGIKYGLARPATPAEAASGTNADNFLTSFLLKEATKSETGRISFFASSRVPYSNYLVCDGSYVPKASYSRLYNYLRNRDYDTPLTDTAGTSPYGESGGLFRLPDLRGRFPRGWSGSVEPSGASREATSLDPGRALGSYQEDQLISHGHSVNDPGHSHSLRPYRAYAEGSGTNGDGAELTSIPGGSNIYPNVAVTATGITITPTGGSETRPDNIALLPCIRYQ